MVWGRKREGTGESSFAHSWQKWSPWRGPVDEEGERKGILQGPHDFWGKGRAQGGSSMRGEAAGGGGAGIRRDHHMSNKATER